MTIVEQLDRTEKVATLEITATHEAPQQEISPQELKRLEKEKVAEVKRLAKEEKNRLKAEEKERKRLEKEERKKAKEAEAARQAASGQRQSSLCCGRRKNKGDGAMMHDVAVQTDRRVPRSNARARVETKSDVFT